ncbi:MAG: hypothetical protein JXR96_21050 [Deltaproteobacteria bacterium]|nr:hypothetical protein [Deltaproteobacteria bacterium]
MRPETSTLCPACGRPLRDDERVVLPEGRSVCVDCLLRGKVFATANPPRLGRLARILPTLHPKAASPVADAMTLFCELMDRKDYDRARCLLIEAAEREILAGRPMTAAYLLTSALVVPGQSAPVYIFLGEAARIMGCDREALQHYKTGAWLAMKVEDVELVHRTRDALVELRPADDYLDKLSGWLQDRRLEHTGAVQDPAPTCSFCGRAIEAGQVARGSNATICRDCVRKLAAEMED